MRCSALIKKRAIRAFCIAVGQPAARGQASLSRKIIDFNVLSDANAAAQFLMKS
jgi:hypothetical protein